MKKSRKQTKKNGLLPLGVGLYLNTQAAKITQTTSRKLTYWAKTKLVEPHIHRRNGGPSVYAYNDLLAIRVMERIRDSGLPLQRMRRAIKYFYSYLGDESDWWNLKLVVDKKDLLAVIPREKTVTGKDETVIASRDGQKPLELVFADLVNDLLAGGKLEEYPEIKKYINIDKKVHGGEPVISKTRIKTSVIYMWYKRGLSVEQIYDMYYGVEKEAIQAAIDYEKALNKNNGKTNIIV